MNHFLLSFLHEVFLLVLCQYLQEWHSGPPKRPKTAPTENQVAAQRRFLLASQYAKNILQYPDMLAAYTARSRDGLSPYILAMPDWLNCEAITNTPRK